MTSDTTGGARDYRKVQMIMDLRTRGIRDNRVLEAIEAVPRQRFVAEPFADQAWADQSLPLECGQTISQPFIVAFMTQALALGDRMKVLEVGTGSGYQTAVLARLARRVYTLERYRTLHKRAADRFEQLGIRNITAMVGDGARGWPAQAPFERIIVTAAAMGVPRPLLEQLADGGVMVVPVEVSPGRQELQRITRAETGFEREALLPVRFVPLVEGVAREL